MPPRRRSQRTHPIIDQAPLALSIHGDVIVGIGYCASAKTIAEAIEVLRTIKLAPDQRLYIGVLLGPRWQREALRRLDDASAEIAATSEVGQRRPRRGQR